MRNWHRLMVCAVLLTGALASCYGPTGKGNKFVAHDDYTLLGYSTKGQVSREFRTVHVPIFKNRTFYRRFEFELTQAVIETIEQRTHMKVVNDPARADTVLQGEIVDFKQHVAIENKRDQVQEYQVTLVVSIRWINQKTGKDILVEPRLRENEDAVLVHGESVLSAGRESFKEIAERVVEKMESDW